MAEKSVTEEDPMIEYKLLLRQYLDRRPSGTRQKLAVAIGTHKSFISQITNTAYRVPLPAQHIPSVFRVCHLSEEEQQRFLDVYSRAHPNQSGALGALATIESNALRISLPASFDVERRTEVEQVIREFADRVIKLAQLEEKT